jgi:hypothetical protein
MMLDLNQFEGSLELLVEARRNISSVWGDFLKGAIQIAAILAEGIKR